MMGNYYCVVNEADYDENERRLVEGAAQKWTSTKPLSKPPQGFFANMYRGADVLLCEVLGTGAEQVLMPVRRGTDC